MMRNTLVTLFNDESVVRKFDIFGQQMRVAFVHYVVIQVREKCAFGCNASNIIESFRKAEMGRMRLDPDAVEDENIESLQCGDRLLGNKI